MEIVDSLTLILNILLSNAPFSNHLTSNAFAKNRDMSMILLKKDVFDVCFYR